MRHFLFVALMLAGTGCQGFRDRLDCRRGTHGCKEPCGPAETKATKPAEQKAPPKQAETKTTPMEQVTDPVRTAMAQEVLLVPRMVYMPFVAQSPTAPMRFTSNMTVVPPSGPKEQVTPPPAETKTDVDLEKKCKELSERMLLLEKCLRDRDTRATVTECPPVMAPICPPTVAPCPPTVAPPCPPGHHPLLPKLFRGPWFQRCDTPQPCEPGFLAPEASVPQAAPEAIAAPKKLPQGN